MTKPRSIDDVFDDLGIERGNIVPPADEFRANLKQEFKQLLLSEMPGGYDMEYVVERNIGGTSIATAEGYNQALKEVQETIERIMG